MMRTVARGVSRVALGSRQFSATVVARQPVYYTKSHEWVNIEGSNATLGITQFAQEELGEVVYVDLPEVGDDVTATEEYGTVESVKATAPLISPVTGKVAEKNEKLIEDTSLLNESPEVNAWTVKLTDVVEKPDDLLDRQEYDAYLQSESE